MKVLTYKYCFKSPNMGKTSDFELITDKNLERLGITRNQIDTVESFEYLPGTLYPEQGSFSKYHPCGGSFGTHIHLKEGRDAWLYGRLSYDYNVNQDHWNREPHWNFDIQAVTPEGKYLDAYKGMAWHGLPDSEFLEVATINLEGKKVRFKIEKK